MVGLSLSLCIKDCIEGRINPDDIQLIIAGTKCEKEADWHKVINSYGVTYWLANPHLGKGIAWQLVFAGKIIQPRLYGMDAPDLSIYSRWMDCQSIMLEYVNFIENACIGVRKEYDERSWEDEPFWQWEVC